MYAKNPADACFAIDGNVYMCFLRENSTQMVDETIEILWKSPVSSADTSEQYYLDLFSSPSEKSYKFDPPVATMNGCTQCLSLEFLS